MPSAVPQIFDRRLLRWRLERAAGIGAAHFLLDHVAAELTDRLSLIRRPFPHVLDLGTPGSQVAESLAATGRAVIRAAPISAGRAGGAAMIVADEEALPFAPASFDLITSALALQSVNDLPGALVQIRRILRPDGLFLGALLGGQTLNELRTAFAAAEAEVTGGASPRVAPFADIRDLGALLQRAGFALPVSDIETLTVHFPDMLALMRDLRAMGLGNVLAARSRLPLPRQVLIRAAAIYGDLYANAAGRLRATFDIVWLLGWAPHDSQQKPLTPGSAKTRLADALGTAELPAGEKAR